MDYNYFPWGDGRNITLLTPPSGEPYVAIAELVAKVSEETIIIYLFIYLFIYYELIIIYQQQNNL